MVISSIKRYTRVKQTAVSLFTVNFNILQFYFSKNIFLSPSFWNTRFSIVKKLIEINNLPSTT